MFNKKTHLILVIVCFLLNMTIILIGVFANEKTLNKYSEITAISTVSLFFLSIFLLSKFSKNF